MKSLDALSTAAFANPRSTSLIPATISSTRHISSSAAASSALLYLRNSDVRAAGEIAGLPTLQLCRQIVAKRLGSGRNTLEPSSSR
jgi:hypothetical protein